MLLNQATALPENARRRSTAAITSDIGDHAPPPPLLPVGGEVDAPLDKLLLLDELPLPDDDELLEELPPPLLDDELPLDPDATISDALALPISLSSDTQLIAKLHLIIDTYRINLFFITFF